MSKKSHAENRDPGHAGDPGGGSRSVVVAFVATAIVLHGTFASARRLDSDLPGE